MENERFELGDIIYDSWGYDQTQYDFAQIVEISKSGKTVKAKMMRAKTVKTTRTSDVIVPTEVYGMEFRLWVRESWRGESAFVGQYPYIYSDQDSKRKGCFTHWEGDPVYETNSQHGH